MIAPYKLTWQELSSLDFDVWTELSFDSDSGQTSTFLNRENIITEHYDGRRIIHRTKYQEVLTSTITFVKQNYGDFNQSENRKILSWLTSSDKPGWLEIYHDDSNSLSYRLWGNWTEIEQYKLANGRVIGYVASFESVAPYAYSRLMKYPTDPDNSDEVPDYLQVSGTKSFILTCNTDEYNKLIYPKVTINFNAGEIYIPIGKSSTDIQDPTIDQYRMMPNTIYHNESTNKYYVNVPEHNYKGEIAGIFATDIGVQTADYSTMNKYYYCSIDRNLYKGIQTFELAKTYDSGVTIYYIDDKGTQAEKQPTAENFDEMDYYVSKGFGWEMITSIGTGVQIENSSVLNEAGEIAKTTIVGCKPKGSDTYGEQIIFDGENKVVSSSLTPMRIIGDDFNWVWVPLTAGENQFTIIGDCQIKFEWIEPRKVGSL